MVPYNKMLSQLRDATNGVQKLQQDLPRMAGVEWVKVVKDNFIKEGYDSGEGFKKWAPRKESTNRAYDRGRVHALKKEKVATAKKLSKATGEKADRLRAHLQDINRRIAQAMGPLVKNENGSGAVHNGGTPKKPRASKSAGQKKVEQIAKGAKRPRNSTYKGSVYSSLNPILRQTGSLFRSIKYWVSGDGKTVKVGSDDTDVGPGNRIIKYATAMNDGVPSKNIPARQFIPMDRPNKKMIDAFLKKFDYERRKVMKNFLK